MAIIITIADTVGLSDEVVNNLLKTVLIQENIGIVDADIDQVADYIRQFLETADITESLRTAISYILNKSDTVTILDDIVILLQQNNFSEIFETIGLTDSVVTNIISNLFIEQMNVISKITLEMNVISKITLDIRFISRV